MGVFLQAVAEVFLEPGDEAFGPVADGLHRGAEAALHAGDVVAADGADEAAVVVEPFQAVEGVHCLGQCQHLAGKCHTDEFHIRDEIRVILRDIGVGTAVHGPHSGAQVNGCGEGTGGQVLHGQMAAELLSVYLGSEQAPSTPGGVTIGMPILTASFTKYLMNSGFWQMYSSSVASYSPWAMASISFMDMPP